MFSVYYLSCFQSNPWSTKSLLKSRYAQALPDNRIVLRELYAFWCALIVVRTISKIYCLSQNFLHPGKQPEELFTEADGNAARSTGKEETSKLGGRTRARLPFQSLGFWEKNWNGLPNLPSSPLHIWSLSFHFDWQSGKLNQSIVIQQIVSKAILTPWTESESRWSLVVITFFNLWLSRLVNECVRVAEELPLSNLWPHLLFK